MGEEARSEEITAKDSSYLITSTNKYIQKKTINPRELRRKSAAIHYTVKLQNTQTLTYVCAYM